MRIRKGDLVKIISGVVAARTPPQEQPARRVLQVLDGGEKVVVEGVNLVYKHVKRGHPKSPQGGRLRLEATPLQALTVAVVLADFLLYGVAASGLLALMRRPG